MPPVPLSDEDELLPIILRLHEMVDELAVDMQQIQWRLAKLERQFGTAAND